MNEIKTRRWGDRHSRDARFAKHVATFTRDATPTKLSEANVQPVYEVFANTQGHDLGSVAGVVTLPCSEREVSAPQGLLGGPDRRSPRAHRRGAKHAVRLGGSKMALDAESVVDGGVRGEKFLRGTRTLEPLHLALPQPRRLMRILCSVVLPSPALMAPFDQKVSDPALYDRKSSVTSRSGTKAYFFKSLRINFSAACLFRLDWTAHRGLTLGIDGPPQVDHSTVNF